MKNNESKLQQACVRWFRFNYPSMRNLLFAIPNGGLRNIKTAVRLKAEGVVAGVPDLFLALATEQSPGLFIEMKFGENEQTEAQKIMQRELTGQNFEYSVCYTIDEFMTTIKTYLQ